LHQFAHGTPGGFILRWFALPEPKLAGVGVALAEIAIGLMITAGLVTRVAAAAGLALNLLLFLTASWTTTPYFLGSDIVFVFAWLPFVLSGATGQPALDNYLSRVSEASLAAARRAAAARQGTRSGRRVPATPDRMLTRRALVTRAVGGTGVLALALAAVSAFLKGSYRGATTSQLGAQATGAGSGPSAPAGTSSTGTGTSKRANGRGGKPSSQAAAASGSAKPPSNAVRLGASSQLPRNQAALYRDPGDGQPDIVIRHSNGSLDAFSAVCTHQGCEVGYQSGQIVCPCHGGVYNASTGAVEGGPPPAPLGRRRVIEYHRSIYAIPD
ncbi:MAG: Rieske (2Fe-2S) protein, partial [Solirubrobacteraceae bacterium]